MTSTRVTLVIGKHGRHTQKKGLCFHKCLNLEGNRKTTRIRFNESLTDKVMNIGQLNRLDSLIAHALFINACVWTL